MTEIVDLAKLASPADLCAMIREKLAGKDPKSVAYESEVNAMGSLLHSHFFDNRWCRAYADSLHFFWDVFTEFPGLSGKTFTLFTEFYQEQARMGILKNMSSSSSSSSKG